MKFDQRYEGIQLGFKDNKEGIIRGILPGYCSQCRRTRKAIYWQDMKTRTYVCSEECLEKARVGYNSCTTVGYKKGEK